MKRFDESPSWITYQRILEKEFDLRLDFTPQEQRINVRGHMLRYDEWLPATWPAGTVILVHGAGGNGRILAPFAEIFAAQGWRVIAPDLPGFGLTEPAPSFRWEYAEWPAVIVDLAARQSGPVALMGLSMGGLTAFLAAQQSDAVEAVIATTLLDLSDPKIFALAARWRWLGSFSGWSMRVLPWIMDQVWLPLRLVTPLNLMTANKRLRAYFNTDPMLGNSWKPVRFFRTLHQYELPALNLRCPFLLVHPGADEWTPVDLSLPLYEKIQSDKQLLVLSNGSHAPIEQPALEELRMAMTDFLKAKLPVHSS
ncbi:MAG: alpha/beta hydrolase [Aquisalinus sp.]|nr:alpha/beta hydrolase [Aquisalinus sp.]